MSGLDRLYNLFNNACLPDMTKDHHIDTLTCAKALEETRVLANDPSGNKPETIALLSFMLLESSRFPAIEVLGENKRGLKYQDRTLWDRALMEEGLIYLKRSAEGEQVSIYHLKAAVSACHSLAKDYRSTDWKKIVSLYEHYLEFNNSAEIALERAEALSHLGGARAEIKAIEEAISNYRLDGEHCILDRLGGLYSRLHDYKNALIYFEKACAQAQTESEKRIYKKRINYCKMRLRYKKKYTLELSF